MTLKRIVQILWIIYCVVVLIWLFYQPGFEPFGALIAGIIGLVMLSDFSGNLSTAVGGFIGKIDSEYRTSNDGESKKGSIRGIGVASAKGTKSASVSMGDGGIMGSSSSSISDADQYDSTQEEKNIQ